MAYFSTFGIATKFSAFYRDHKSKIYCRWAETAPEEFSLSVKLNRRLTHEQKLSINESKLVQTLEGIHELGQNWGTLFV